LATLVTSLNRVFIPVFIFCTTVAAIIIIISRVAVVVPTSAMTIFIFVVAAVIVRVIAVIGSPGRIIRVVIIRGIPRRIVTIITIRVIPRRIAITDPERPPTTITNTIPGIGVITQVEIIKRRPGVIGSTGITI
jgi:hypothetical protein